METAFVLPVFLVLVMGMLETARLVYVRSVLESDARAAVRAMVADDARSSDCAAQQAGMDSGGGLVTITMDPASYFSASPVQSSNPSSVQPASNQGFLYLYPAAAMAVNTCGNVCTQDPPNGNCAVTLTDSSGATFPFSGVPIDCRNTDTAYETYNFVPLAPALGSIAMQVSASEDVQTPENGCTDSGS